MAGRDELARRVFAEHERPDRILGDRGRDESGDDEGAMLRALDLEPRLDPPGTVRSRGPLRDDTLKAEAAGVAENWTAVAAEMLAESDAAVVAVRGKELAERRLPLRKRRISQIEAIDEEKIERIEGEIASTTPKASISPRKLAMPVSVWATISPSISPEVRGRTAAALAIVSNRSVQSRPCRVRTVTRPSAMRSCTR